MQSLGRVTLNLPGLPEQVTIRQIKDEFIIGIGTSDRRDGSGSIPIELLYQFRANGINYFLPFMKWASIERSEGDYSGDPNTGEEFVRQIAKSGALVNGHDLVFFITDPALIPKFIPPQVPEFVVGRPFEEQKDMVERYIKATMERFPEVEMWTLCEPIWQSGLGWSLEQNYEVWVAASKWIHQVNPKAKVMANMIPVPCQRADIYYEPKRVMDDLMSRGLEADVIGVELYYDDGRHDYWVTDPSELDQNGFPTMEWVKDKINIYSSYNLPIILSETSVAGRMYGKDLWTEQADWLEQYFKVCHDERGVIGATWYFVKDRDGLPYGGLMNDDYSFRPAGERLLKLVNDRNPAYIHQLEGKDFVDLEAGKYDIVIGKSTFRITVSPNEVVALQ